MDFVWILFGIIFSLIFFIIMSFFAGRAFREWNEGTNNVKDNKASNIKTFVIGIIILSVLLFIYSKCES